MYKIHVLILLSEAIQLQNLKVAFIDIMKNTNCNTLTCIHHDKTRGGYSDDVKVEICICKSKKF